MNHLGLSAGRTWARRAGAVAAAVGTAISLPMPAMAAQAPTAQQPTYTTQALPGGAVSQTVTLPPGTTEAHFGAGGAQAAVVKTPNTTNAKITCHLRLNPPVKRNRYYVFAGSNIQCDHTVAHLINTLVLWRSGHGDDQRFGPYTKEVSGQSYITHSITEPCAYADDHSWRTKTVGGILYPPGYNPRTGQLGPLTSVWKHIKCH